jgi:hypothetical protein
MSGRLGKADLTANTDTDLYTVPASNLATVNVYFANRTSAAIRVRLAVRSGALANADYLEFDSEVPANGVLERTKIPVEAGEIITVRANATGISAQVRGFEEVGS